MATNIAVEARRDRVCQLGAVLAMYVPDEFLIGSDSCFEAVVQAVTSLPVAGAIDKALLDNGLVDENGRVL